MTLLEGLVGGTFLGALLLAAWRPWIAAAVFLALVAPTSSLPWQLGFVNVSLPFVFLVGLLGGLGLGELRRRLQGRDAGGAGDRTTLAAIATLLFVAASLVVSLSRLLTLDTASVFLTQDLWPRVALFNPGNATGQVQAALTLAAAPLLMLWGRRADWWGGPRSAGVLAAAVVGFGVVALAPLMQLPFLDTLTIRPDLGRTSGTGIVGFQQDPHAYAALLIVSIGCCVAGGQRAWSSGTRAPAVALFGVALAGLVSLWLTGSRGGLVGLLATAACLLAMRREPSAARGRAAVVIGVLVVAVVASGLGGGSVQRARDTADADGAPPAPVPSSLTLRLVPWLKGVHLVGRHPIWGVGPGAYPTAMVAMDNPAPDAISEGRFVRQLGENAHNYYLQLAAEIGLPGLLSFLALLAAGLAALLSAVRGPPESWTTHAARGLFASQVGVLVMSLGAHPLLLPEIQGTYWLLTVTVAGGLNARRAADPRPA